MIKKKKSNRSFSRIIISFVLQFKNDILAKNNNLMDTFEEKRSLLLDMIAFSTVDGFLHKKEYDFLFNIANELDMKKGGFNDLFHLELPQLPIKSEFQRIQQFYRLALLMHSDGILHKKESVTIRQIGIEMGLNPSATKRILKLMSEAPNTIINPAVLLNIFQEQHN